MTLSPALRSLLDRAQAAPSSFARTVATDADGTLWDCDVGDDLFCLVAARDDFRGEGLARLRSHGARWLGPESATDTGKSIAERLFAMYGNGVIDVRTMCDLQAETVADRALDEMTALIEDVAAEAARKVRVEVRELLTAAHASGYRVEVVTGSLGWAVERALDLANIPHDRVSGAVLAKDGRHVYAKLERTSPLFEGKVDALREGGAWPAAMGLGDGGWDHTFLRQTFVPVLVHPKPALVDAMRDVPTAARI
jgi:phosphoserine phosphatase